MIEQKSSRIIFNTLAYTILILISLCCAVPFWIVLAASFSNEGELLRNGYSILIQKPTLDAYRVLLTDIKEILKSYGVTVFVTLVGSCLGILVTAMTAYPLSLKNYKWRKPISFYLYFTMLFSGGAIPTYIVISQLLHLKNTVFVLILPILLNVWNVFLLRTYFSQVHISLIEAARIDGAREYGIFFRIVFPMCKTGIVTVLLLITLSYWNDWYLNLIYISNEQIVNLQYYLYKIISSVNELKKSASSAVIVQDGSRLPSETVRMAICMVAAGPMVFVFLFFQKYFVKGIAVGSVKG